MDEKQKPLFNINLAAELLEKAYATQKENERAYKGTWGKLTDVLNQGGLVPSLIQPFFSGKFSRALEPDEESEAGTELLTIKSGALITKFASMYRKMLQIVEERTGTKRSIDDVKVEVTLFKGKDKFSACRGNISVSFSQSADSSPRSYFIQSKHDFGFIMDVEAYAYGLLDTNIPDVEERSIASPVYLVQSQHVKTTFGKTVKEDPEHIYLAARWAGWSGVRFYGAQVLLMANVSVQ